VIVNLLCPPTARTVRTGPSCQLPKHASGGEPPPRAMEPVGASPKGPRNQNRNKLWGDHRWIHGF
jgi:hypothetical protein